MKHRPIIQRGFTLVEAIIAIVVIGVLSAVVAVFIRMPIQGYVDSTERAALTDDADLALRRMARDLRLALPNSVRVTPDGHSIEFLLTRAGGRYLAAEDGVDKPFLNFLDAKDTEFTVVGAMPHLSRSIQEGDSIVVYNLGPGFGRANAYLANSPAEDRNIAQIAVGGITRDSKQNVVRIRMVDNPFGRSASAGEPPSASPEHRFQVVSTPVTYSCDARNGGNALTRYWNYPISQVQPNPPPAAAAKALLAEHVADCAGIFRYTNTTQRSGLIILSLSLKGSDAAQPVVRLVHQVHVDNTP